MQTKMAAFWRRGVALLVDVLILAGAGYLVGFTLARAWASSFGTDYESLEQMQTLLFFALLGLAWLYFASFESGEAQATPGKRLLGLRVVQEDGLEIGFWRASARFALKVVSAALLGVGFWMALGSSRRALHDRGADTLVVMA